MPTILVIEDDKKTNEAICEYLNHIGHEAIPVYDGEEALRVFAEHKINLAVLDIMLPKMTGLAVLHEIKKTSSVPILMLTAIGDVTVDFSGYAASDSKGKIDITPKEISLLKLLVEYQGLVLTRSQILDVLWGNDFPVIDRTVDTYIKNLRKKLYLDCIVTVKGVGYKKVN